MSEGERPAKAGLFAGLQIRGIAMGPVPWHACMPLRRMTGSNIMTDARPRKRILGDTDLSVSPVGLGCMGMSEFYGPAMDERAAVALLQEAVECGVNHFDTAEMYGIGHNETLVGRALRDRREGLVIATKCGMVWDAGSTTV